MSIAKSLIHWYRANKRDLPWRDTSDPYLIWLSEIILQQTRVDQGMPYYYRFAEQYPDVKSFAAASEDEILRLWQGLGYYSRGRNMLKTAQKIMEKHQGVFPSSFTDLIELVGIGEYTASAISSFSANEARAVVDGNVYRLLSRYYGIETPINSTQGKKEFQEIANSILDNENAGEHNQAIIEFGALQCKPRNPDCATCVLSDNCVAFQTRRTDQLPVKLKKVKPRERFLYYFVVKNGGQILMKKRGNDDIWAGLYDFPMIEKDQHLPTEQLMVQPDVSQWIGEQKIKKIHLPVKHILTHQKIYATFIELDALSIHNPDWIWLDLNALHQFGQPKLIFAFLNKLLN